ncbi:MAG: hypothetical protein ACD_51C00312G0004 [uncultured bacterium]|nr:MAG: hypothetical protein ACD_51C00312G0004 [uncultured bacterium]OGJ47037.1 MAG: hypothetical protein A2244_04845 [Candidatus Peregrinibacteria bacterium RIFOXYA2_FULL_41_18]OGJ49725.1 MAG: hypothetical protein A2344_03505 [Candidatus Peregrinibacteria bacterium RIFOXYB12_FULL_41_12]OGJ53522.1 MAG: hypothetical protein A2448_01620 [Candidatus Peregrinibacteria bacterium RIFOXYC2_FULL_41_22]
MKISKMFLVIPLLGIMTQSFGCAVEPKTTETIVSFEKTISVTPDDTYQYGAFCRVNYLESSSEFFVTFGGSQPDIQKEQAGERIGGAEGGNGYSYKIYDEDFSYTEENGIVHEGGGDAASVFAEGYYYFLAGSPNSNWAIEKIDPSTWEVVEKVEIYTDEEHEALNDQMLAYVNGYLIASSLYNEEGETNQQKTDATKGYATHNRIFTLDLEEVDYFVLDDTPHINGSYLVYVDGVYNYITSTAFFGDIIVMQYDEDWNYLGVKTIEENGNWAQGALYDEATERFYVTYLSRAHGEGGVVTGSKNGVIMGVFDNEWNLIENIEVAVFDDNSNTLPGRPSVIMQNDKLYVSYDLSTRDPQTHEENKDWQCEVSIYEIDNS